MRRGGWAAAHRPAPRRAPGIGARKGVPQLEWRHEGKKLHVYSEGEALSRDLALWNRDLAVGNAGLAGVNAGLAAVNRDPADGPARLAGENRHLAGVDRHPAGGNADRRGVNRGLLPVRRYPRLRRAPWNRGWGEFLADLLVGRAIRERQSPDWQPPLQPIRRLALPALRRAPWSGTRKGVPQLELRNEGNLPNPHGSALIARALT